MSWKIIYTRQAQKDAKKLVKAGLQEKAKSLLAIIQEHPFQNPPSYEKLIGDLEGAYSRRIILCIVRNCVFVIPTHVGIQGSNI